MVEKYLGEVNSYFKCLLQKKGCLSVCLPDFFESADARDLGRMTLLGLTQNSASPGHVSMSPQRYDSQYPCTRETFLRTELFGFNTPAHLTSAPAPCPTCMPHSMIGNGSCKLSCHFNFSFAIQILNYVPRERPRITDYNSLYFFVSCRV